MKLASTIAFLCMINIGQGSLTFSNGRLREGFLAPPPDEEGSREPIVARYFTQNLDHFNDADIRTWQQKYYVNDEYYEPGGPVFLMLGGEGPASVKWMTNGQWVNWAKIFKALCIQIEHRYYGDSHPTPDLSVKNLAYLSSRQALADFSIFQANFQQEHNLTDNKWIAFGGSYSGSLAAWYRLKYPHLIHGSVASSAPLLADLNFVEYLEVVRDSLGTECSNNFRLAFDEAETLLDKSQGRQILKQILRLCDAIDDKNPKDLANLYSTMVGNINEIVQYNRDNRISSGKSNITIDTVCSMMGDNSKGSPIKRFAALNSQLMQVSNQTCLDFVYQKMIKTYTNITWEFNQNAGGRQWLYQTCTEFGFFQSSDSDNQPFGNRFPVEFSIDQCMDIFGPRFNRTLIENGIGSTNVYYGALRYGTSRVLFPNGSVDPWHALGILNDVTNTTRPIFINGTAHCADMYPSSPDDLKSLSDARTQIQNTLQNWLQV